MEPLNLPNSEKDQMAYWLSKQAVIGGWFFIGMAGVTLLLILFAGWRAANKPISDMEAFYGSFITLGLLFVGVGVWLMRRRQKIRQLLDEPLFAGDGRVLSKKLDTYGGHIFKLHIQTGPGKPLTASMGTIGKTTWEVGDEIALVFWDNGRFCPRYFDHMVSLAQLPTPERKRFVRNRILLGILVYFFLVALAIIFALYGQGRL
jgi:hypothetical protein